jgi:hypothetical protein
MVKCTFRSSGFDRGFLSEQRITQYFPMHALHSLPDFFSIGLLPVRRIGS